VTEQAPASLARAIIDEISYMTLGTADENGLPWVSPVWFASDAYREFFWVSLPERRHSRNIATRPEVAIVIFDSRVPISTGQAVYMSAVAEEVTGRGVERGIEIFSRRSEAEGARPWSLDDVRGEARLRLYRATASEHFVLSPQDDRIPVDLTD
jgi:nitroimidazol reductase NimA-like FMN-containing flavoprotein (pyridoxamine 5'-phosphate oxidase superfamily)